MPVVIGILQWRLRWSINLLQAHTQAADEEKKGTWLAEGGLYTQNLPELPSILLTLSRNSNNTGHGSSRDAQCVSVNLTLTRTRTLTQTLTLTLTLTSTLTLTLTLTLILILFRQWLDTVLIALYSIQYPLRLLIEFRLYHGKVKQRSQQRQITVKSSSHNQKSIKITVMARCQHFRKV